MKQAEFESKLQDKNYKEQLIIFYGDHNQKDTIKQFNLSWGNLLWFIKQEGLQKSAQERHSISASYTSKKHQESIKQLQELVPYNILIDYYQVQNHSYKECCEHFNLSSGRFAKLLASYDYHKPDDQHQIKIKESKIKNHGDATYNNRIQAQQTCIDKYGVTNPSQLVEVQQKGYQTKCLNNGEDNPNNWRKNHQTRIQNAGSLEASYSIGKQHREQTNLIKYGVSSTSSLPEIKQ